MKTQTLCVALVAVALPTGAFAADRALNDTTTATNPAKVVRSDEAKTETANLEIKGMT